MTRGTTGTDAADGGCVSRGGRALRGRSALVALAAATLIAAALALPIAASAAQAPEAGGTLDLQAWPDSGQLIIVTAITVPADVPLPVTVRVPVPDGANVQWTGEVLGGDLSEDPERPHKLIKSPVGGQYAEFTLEETRSAQVDADMPALKASGNITSASFEWIQSVSSPSTSFSVRLPADSSNAAITPQPSAPPEANAVGELLYTGDSMVLAPGQKQAVSFSYTTGGGSAPGTGGAGSTSGGDNSLVVALSIALGVVAIAFVALVLRQRMGSSASAAAAGDEPESPGPSDSYESDTDEESGVADDGDADGEE